MVPAEGSAALVPPLPAEGVEVCAKTPVVKVSHAVADEEKPINRASLIISLKGNMIKYFCQSPSKLRSLNFLHSFRRL